jgi:hypothetical protein
MTDPKTTITAVVTGILAALAYFGIVIPETFVAPIIGIGVVILGIFAKDAVAKPPAAK